MSKPYVGENTGKAIVKNVKKNFATIDHKHSWNELEDRPFGEIEGYIIPETEIDMLYDEDEGISIAYLPFQDELTSGEFYRIKWGNDFYECECLPMLELGVYVLGNINLIMGEEPTNEPFIFMWHKTEKMISIISLTESTTEIVSMYGQYKKLISDDFVMFKRVRINLNELGLGLVDDYGDIQTITFENPNDFQDIISKLREYIVIFEFDASAGYKLLNGSFASGDTLSVWCTPDEHTYSTDTISIEKNIGGNRVEIVLSDNTIFVKMSKNIPTFDLSKYGFSKIPVNGTKVSVTANVDRLREVLSNGAIDLHYDLDVSSFTDYWYRSFSYIVNGCYDSVNDLYQIDTNINVEDTVVNVKFFVTPTGIEVIAKLENEIDETELNTMLEEVFA